MASFLNVHVHSSSAVGTDVLASGAEDIGDADLRFLFFDGLSCIEPMELVGVDTKVTDIESKVVRIP
jgi:hypothetical protein